MTPARFAKLAAADRVEVRDFGTHPGIVVQTNPAVTIQSRSAERRGWIKVRLDDGREWSGAFKLVAFRAPAPLRTA